MTMAPHVPVEDRVRLGVAMTMALDLRIGTPDVDRGTMTVRSYWARLPVFQRRRYLALADTVIQMIKDEGL